MKDIFPGETKEILQWKQINQNKTEVLESCRKSDITKEIRTQLNWGRNKLQHKRSINILSITYYWVRR
jgi:hypothetical protein